MNHVGSKYSYIIGQRFNKLTPVEYLGKSKFRCLCACGNETTAGGKDIISGRRKTCGCEPIYVDMTGEKILNFTVLSFSHSSGNHAYWNCRCEQCGKVSVFEGRRLRKGKAVCTCDRKRTIDITGKVFHELIVESFAEVREDGKAYWNCLCSCGNHVVVSGKNLRNGNTKSCGCLRKRKGEDNPQFEDITGKQFGNYLVAKRHIDGRYWEFYCKGCGQLRRLNSNGVRMGNIISCGCLNVSSRGSQSEYDIAEYIATLTSSEVSAHSRILGKKEIDLFYKDYNIGIEYNGSVFHASTGNPYTDKPKLYHQQKFLSAKKRGIHLISIFDVDWAKNREKIEMYLRSLFVKNISIFARKCVVKSIDKATADTFTDKYHIQGSARQNSINYGLYYRDELYAVMSFGNYRLKTSVEGEYELHRYCVKDGYTIIGGAEKLLKAFEREYAPKKILSYSDNDYFLGGIYIRLGFEDCGQSTPRYYWYLNGKEIKREKCQLKYLKQEFPNLLNEAIEKEALNKEDYVMLALGACKVYHSGNTKWVKTYA